MRNSFKYFRKWIFCKIPYNNNYINDLFTNNHVINEKLLLPGKKIRLDYKNIVKEIELT